MRSLFLQYGNNADAIVAGASSPPSRVLHNIHRELLRGLTEDEAYLPDFRKTDTPLAVQLATRCGMGRFGRCVIVSNKPRRLSQKSRVVIHWPSFIKEAYDLVYRDISLAMFFMSFEPIIRLRSPFLVEALQRNYAKCIYRLMAANDQPLKQSPLVQVEVPDVEGRVAVDMLQKLAKEEEFVQMMQHACCASYTDFDYRKERYKIGKLRVNFPGPEARQSSLLYPAREDKCSHKVHLSPKVKLSYDLFGRSDLPPLLDELMVALHLATVWARPSGWQKLYVDEQVKTLGVAVLPAAPGGVLFINWERWYQYRLNLRTTEVYQNAVASLPEYRKIVTNTEISQYGSVMSNVCFSLYPSINLSLLTLENSTKNLEKAWGSAFGPSFVSAFSIKELLQLRMRLRKTRETVGKAPKRKSRSSSLERLDYNFPLIVGNTEVTCRAVHTGRKLWFIPPWDMSHAHIFKNTGVTGDAWNKNNLQPGIIKLKDTGEIAYDVRFLSRRDLSPGTPTDPEVLEQLRIITKTLKRADIRAVVAPVDSKPPGHPLSFTDYEDGIITRLYRPDISREDLQAIQEVCTERSIKAISRRASVLRRRLMAEGVYDLDDLPHGRYNHRIKFEIDKAKASADKED